MKTQLMLRTLAVTISLGAFALISCTSQSTAEAPAAESPATESPSVAPSPQTPSNRQTMNPNQANTQASQPNNPYVGMWVTKDGYIRHEFLPNNRYDEARGVERAHIRDAMKSQGIALLMLPKPYEKSSLRDKAF
ncbi:Atu4866 domain-containing protein [Leptolyngbya sp. AN03gr2]|uniref:Atu4866 domain-containing protein n=1 Tax=unclassified Leptolyngbya TaxID=2650499 RepID=UPI003D3223CF